MNINFLDIESTISNSYFLLLFLATIYYWFKIIFFSSNNIDKLSVELLNTSSQNLEKPSLKKNQIKSKTGFLILLVVNLLITIQLIERWLESGHFPLSGLYESLIFLSWSILFFYLLIEYWTNSELLGIVICPLLLTITGFTGFSLPAELQQSKPLVPALQSNWLFMHVSVMMLSYGALIFGCVISISYITINFLLKIKKTQSLLSQIKTSAQLSGETMHGALLSGEKLERFSKERSTCVSRTETAQGNLSLLNKIFLLLDSYVIKLNKKEQFSNLILDENQIRNRSDIQVLKSDISLQSSELKLKKLKKNKLELNENSLPAANVTNSALLSGEKLEQFSKETAQGTVSFILKESSAIDFYKPLFAFLDNLSYRTIGVGFCFLTLGILSGAVWANETWGSYWSWDPKETWALITWLTFAIYLHTRFLQGWTGLKPAKIATFGFFIIWICYLGVNLLGKGLHSYGFLVS